GVRCLDREIREGGVLDVVVEVVAVALGEQAGVVHGHRVGGADSYVATVARGVQAHEALELGLIEGRPVGRVEGGDAALMGEHDARGEGTDLGAIGCRRRLAASVGGAPAAVGGSAACGERERARAEEGDRTPLRDNGSHQLHGGSLSADENASQLGGDGPGWSATGSWRQQLAISPPRAAIRRRPTPAHAEPPPAPPARRQLTRHQLAQNGPRAAPAHTEPAPAPSETGRGPVGSRPGGAQITPKAIIASATLRKPATLAPTT